MLYSGKFSVTILLQKRAKNMPYIIGTAGHIDHGKTSLIKALTGLDTDRLKEEKERGISIDLGFAHLDLTEGDQAGIVDVPGHERFIRNMLAGAHGIAVDVSGRGRGQHDARPVVSGEYVGAFDQTGGGDE